MHPDHPWIRFDTFLHRKSSRTIPHKILLATTTISLIVTVIPIYPGRADQVFTIYELAAQYPLIYAIPVFAALAAVAACFTKRTYLLVAAGLSIVTNIGIIGAAMAYTNLDTNVPGVISSCAQVTSFVFPVINGILLYSLLRQPKYLYDPTVPADNNLLKRQNRRLFLARQIQIIASYLGAAGIYQSGTIFLRDLHPAMLSHGTPYVVHVVFSVAAGIIAALTIALQMKVLKRALYSAITYGLVFGLLLFVVYSVNDTTNGMAAAPWLLFFGSFFGLLIMNAVSEQFQSRLKRAILRSEVFDNGMPAAQKKLDLPTGEVR